MNPIQLLANHEHILEPFAKKKHADFTYDQRLITYLILKNGLCSLPHDHGLWTRLQVSQIKGKITSIKPMFQIKVSVPLKFM